MPETGRIHRARFVPPALVVSSFMTPPRGHTAERPEDTPASAYHTRHSEEGWDAGNGGWNGIFRIVVEAGEFSEKAVESNKK